MKNQNFLTLNVAILFVALTILIPFFSPKTIGVYAQTNNSISGQVLGLQREPLYDIYVELLNDYSQTINRVRTNSAGRYTFYGMGAGRFNVRVMPFGTDYEEQTQSVEIVNFTRESQTGGRITSGSSNEQLDFYMRLRRGVIPGTVGTIFVQKIPENAKKLYEKGISDLNDKKEKEGLAELKAAIEAFPKYFHALEKLGLEYVRLQYYEAAQYLLSAAVEVNPRGYNSWYGLAYSFYSLNKPVEGLIAVQKAIEIYPNSVETVLLAGILLRQNKKFDEAEKQLLKANELAKEKNPQVHWHLALLYGNDFKRYADAAKELKTFLKLQPESKDSEKIKQLIADFEAKAQSK